MGKFASRDSTGSPVAWGDITGKPSTFDPNPHDNAAHSTVYAPLASPTFTGTVAAPLYLSDYSGFGFYTSKKNNHFCQNAYYDGSWKSYNADGAAILVQTSGQTTGGGVQRALKIFVDTTVSAPNEALSFTNVFDLKLTGELGLGFTDQLAKLAINGGLHVGGESDPGDNNLLVDGNATAGAFKTANFTILQSGTDLLIQYNGTTVFKLSSAGYLRLANEMEPHAAL